MQRFDTDALLYCLCQSTDLQQDRDKLCEYVCDYKARLAQERGPTGSPPDVIRAKQDLLRRLSLVLGGEKVQEALTKLKERNLYYAQQVPTDEPVGKGDWVPLNSTDTPNCCSTMFQQQSHSHSIEIIIVCKRFDDRIPSNTNSAGKTYVTLDQGGRRLKAFGRRDASLVNGLESYDAATAMTTIILSRAVHKIAHVHFYISEAANCYNTHILLVKEKDDKSYWPKLALKSVSHTRTPSETTTCKRKAGDVWR